MIKFKELNESKHISNKQKSVDFSFYFVIEVIDWESATGNTDSKYCINVNIVSPEQCPAEEFKKVAETMGDISKNDISKVDALNDYGICSPCFQLYGNDLEALLSEAKEKITTLDIETSLSEVKNGCGATGRNLLRGNLSGHSFTMGTLTLNNGTATLINKKQINQGTLTSECWSIQMNGLSACTSCEFLNKRNCGGKRIRKQLLESKE